MITEFFVLFTIFGIMFAILGFSYKSVIMLFLSMAFITLCIPNIYSGLETVIGKNITQETTADNTTITTEQYIYGEKDFFGEHKHFVGILYMALLIFDIGYAISIMLTNT